MIKLKYCGFTHQDDVEVALQLKIEYIGFIFYAKSHRYIEPQKIASWKVDFKNSTTKKVGVFVNETIDNIQKIFDQCKLDIVQLHGDEDEEFCRQLNLPYWKVFRLNQKYNDDEIKTKINEFDDSKAFLLDKYHQQIYGGTGMQIDLEKVTPWLNSEKKVILAGGIKIENIKQFLSLNPYCLDISSGIESELDKTRKSHQKMTEIKKIKSTKL